MKVFLLGYMASGKTTVGRKLAKELKLDFIDLDAYIEAQEKKRVSEIFNEGGEALFRGVEMKCLKELINLEPDALISTGGGTPCYYDNIKDMNQAGLTVYLEMDAKSLTYRLMNAKGDRPLVNKIGEDELLEFVVQQMEERKFYYSEAQIKVNALGFNSGKIKALASQIEEACQSKN